MVFDEARLQRGQPRPWRD